jgi:hypothetical protein
MPLVVAFRRRDLELGDNLVPTVDKLQLNRIVELDVVYYLVPLLVA